MDHPISLTALYVYPLKSARGVPLRRGHLGPRGLDLDRHWMVVDALGRQLTGRQHPSLGSIEVELDSDVLVLSAPGLEPLTIPLRAEGSDCAVSIWREPLPARSVGAAARHWMQTYLGRSCDLVQLDPTMQRRMNPLYGTAQISFVDGNPLHLVSEASLSDLNARLTEPVSVERFRPNLVVSGGEPYAEDSWSHLRAGDLDLALVEPCARCSMVNIEQGQMLAEPLRTLAGYRRSNRTITFGQNLIHSAEGWLEVGQPLWAQARGGETSAGQNMQNPGPPTC